MAKYIFPPPLFPHPFSTPLSTSALRPIPLHLPSREEEEKKRGRRGEEEDAYHSLYIS